MPTNQQEKETTIQDSSGQEQGSLHGIFAIARPSPQRRVLLIVFLSSLAFGLLFQLFPPLLAVIGRQFQVNRSLASLVMALFLAPILLVALPAGVLVSRYGVRLMGQLAFGWLIAGTSVCIVAPTFTVLLIGRVISGVGGGLLVIALLTLITESIPRAERGLALGIFVAGLPAGTGLAFDLLTPLGSRLGWRGEMGIALLIVLGALLLFWRGIPQGTRSAATPSHLGAVLRHGQLWRLALVTLLGYTAIIEFTTWVPTTLVTFARVPLWLGAVIASILLVIDIPFAPLWGAVCDRVGRRKPFIVCGFIVYLVGSLVVPVVASASGWRIAGLLVVITGMGIGCAMFFPAALAIPAETVEPEQVGLAYALFFMAQVGGMLLGPVLIGAVLDFGSATGAFLSVSAITLGGVLVGLTLRGRKSGRSGAVPGSGTSQAHEKVSRNASLHYESDMS
jgi:MFS family permease